MTIPPQLSAVQLVLPSTMVVLLGVLLVAPTLGGPDGLLAPLDSFRALEPYLADRPTLSSTQLSVTRSMPR